MCSLSKSFLCSNLFIWLDRPVVPNGSRCYISILDGLVCTDIRQPSHIKANISQALWLLHCKADISKAPCIAAILMACNANISKYLCILFYRFTLLQISVKLCDFGPVNQISVKLRAFYFTGSQCAVQCLVAPARGESGSNSEEQQGAPVHPALLSHNTVTLQHLLSKIQVKSSKFNVDQTRSSLDQKQQCQCSYSSLVAPVLSKWT